MKIFYRLSDGSYKKSRLENATKEKCFKNFVWEGFDSQEDEMYLFLDNVRDETFEHFCGLAESCGVNVVRTVAGSSAGSFKLVLEEALQLDSDEVVYFVEDDYAHLPGSRKILLEGIERAHYVTLYNHPDKYIPASQGGNPLIGDDGAEETKVFVTKSSYWMATNSTTMTFASTAQVLKEDELTWMKYIQGTYPEDMRIFFELRQRGRSLIQPIPTYSTHCEIPWTAHLHGTGINDWNEFLKRYE